LRVGFIGDIIGKPGREMVKKELAGLREEYRLDIVIANGENASHGFGLLPKNAKELFDSGIDVITGGNHTWDKKEILPLLEEKGRILRPYNYPDGVPGIGAQIYDVGSERLGVLNLMGHYGMPQVDNVFIAAKRGVEYLKESGAGTIFIDFHAETTSEKSAMFAMLKGDVAAIIGTHTHTGTDDMTIDCGTLFLTDIGLTGCRDGVIGMESGVPIKRFLTGLPGKFDIPEKCKRILQVAIFETQEGRCIDGKKVKIYDQPRRVMESVAFKEI